MPQTRTVSIRRFRENLAELLKEAQRKNIHFVVMRHSEPIAHVWPVRKRRMRSLEEVRADIAEARRQAARGEGYTTEEILAMIDRRS
jgi:prevent-host-death family protein